MSYPCDSLGLLLMFRASGKHLSGKEPYGETMKRMHIQSSSPLLLLHLLDLERLVNRRGYWVLARQIYVSQRHFDLLVVRSKLEGCCMRCKRGASWSVFVNCNPTVNRTNPCKPVMCVAYAITTNEVFLVHFDITGPDGSVKEIEG